MEKISLFAKFMLMIIFGSSNDKFCEEFSRIMTKRFEMSMMGEVLPWVSNQENEGRDFLMSIQVCKGYAQEV
jgi:hypothetical protein